LPNHATTPLASGAITNHDEITVILIEPTDGTPALVMSNGQADHHGSRRPLPSRSSRDRSDHCRVRNRTGRHQGSPMAIDAHEKSPGESPGLLSFPCEQPILSVSNKRSIGLERRDPRLSGTAVRTLPPPTKAAHDHQLPDVE
jgi:hypothetical protein